ncbi:hypothetical protein VQ056_03335 [Paenibacillus sp. JTLBN-2024]
MPQTLYIAGDSTAAAKDASQKPMAGWGEYLHHFVTPSLRIDNRAVNGRSTKSFLEEGLVGRHRRRASGRRHRHDPVRP